MSRLGASVLGLAVLAGCHSTTTPKQPPGLPPTPVTVTRDEPGGDADDPHYAALERLTKEGWGWRNDRQDAIHFPLIDWKNWRRVTFWGVPSFAGFRYGDDHHAVAACWVREVPQGESAEPATCMARFEEWGDPTAKSFNVRLESTVTTTARWKYGEVVIKSLDAHVDTLLSHKDYAAAYAAYSMWPGTCTIFGVAVPMRGEVDLAHAVRDRYVKEGFAGMERHTEKRPEL